MGDFSLLPDLLVYPSFYFFFKDFIYLFMRDTDRKAETQAEGEAGSLQGARCGTQSQVSRITPWAKGSDKPLSHPGCPQKDISKSMSSLGKEPLCQPMVRTPMYWQLFSKGCCLTKPTGQLPMLSWSMCLARRMDAL